MINCIAKRITMSFPQIINKVSDDKQDHEYFDVKDLITEEDHRENIEAELLPGEKILKTFQVRTRIRDKRSQSFLIFMYIITLGLYWFYIHVCGCCRDKSAGNHRTKACVTSRGRILLWMSTSEGSNSKAGQTYSARTEFRWFHLHNVTSLQTLYEVDKILPCLNTKNYNTTWKLSVGESYPDAGLWDSGKSGFGKDAVVSGSKIDWSLPLMLQGGARSGFSGLMSLVNGAIGLDGGELTLEVHSGLNPPYMHGNRTWKDEHHKDSEESAWNEGVQFVQFLLNCKISAPTLVGVQPRSQHVMVVTPGSTTELIDNNVVQVDPAMIALGKNETVLDAIPVYVGMSLMECVRCRFLCDRRLRSRGAVILTSKRLISVDEMRALDGDVVHEVSSHFLGKVRAGYIIRNQETVIGGVATNFGGLHLETPVVESRWPCSRTSEEEMHNRMVNFWLLLANGVEIQGMSDGAARSIPPMPASTDADDMFQELPLVSGEHLLATVKSANMWNMDGWDKNLCIRMLSCGRQLAMAGVTRFLTCGMRPYKIDMHLAITDFRVFSVSKVSNSPILPCFKKVEPTVVCWTTLESVKSARLTGDFTTGEAAGKVSRACAAAFDCCNPVVATMQMQLGLGSEYEGHPFQIQRWQPAAKGGLITGEDLLHFRRVMATMLVDSAAQDAVNILEGHATGGAAKVA